MGLFGKKQERNRDACPYCGAIFAKAPKRKATCEKCDGECFVRTKQTLFNSDLLTEEDALAVDFFEELKYLGATQEDYRNVEAELSKKWGTKAKSYDVVWGTSNRLVMNPPKGESNPLHHAKMIAFAQAKYQATRGNDPYSYLQSVHNYEIQIGLNSGLTLDHFVIETQPCCGECSKYQGKKYRAEELKKAPLLPIKECTNKVDLSEKFTWCTCWYSPIYS